MNITYHILFYTITEGVPLMKFMYLVFTRIPSENTAENSNTKVAVVL